MQAQFNNSSHQLGDGLENNPNPLPNSHTETAAGSGIEIILIFSR